MHNSRGGRFLSSCSYSEGFSPSESSLCLNQKAGFPLLSSRNYRAAFTLAEVLITLGVIGIVAALTLPSLITKYQEKQLVTSYLRVYSLLENAYRHVQAEYGTFENWSGAVITINEGDGKPDKIGRAHV